MKQYEVLYINGQAVNIGTSDIALEWKNVILSDISKFTCSHSYTFKLPMTANNRRIFDDAEEAGRQSAVFHGGGTSSIIGKRLPARYVCNGIDLLGEAYVYLLGTEGDCYRAVMTWGSLIPFEALAKEDKKMNEIFADEETEPTVIPYDKQTSSVISEDLGEDVMYLKYDTPVPSMEYGMFVWYLPSLKVTTLMKALFEKYDVAYNLNGADGHVDSLLDSLYCPMTTYNDSEYLQQQAKFHWTLFTDNNNYLIERGDEKLQLTALTKAIDPAVVRHYWDKDDDVYTAWVGLREGMTYDVKLHIRVFAKSSDIIDKYSDHWWETRDATGATQMAANARLEIMNGREEEDASSLLSVGPTYVGADWKDSDGNIYVELRWEVDSQEVQGNDAPGNDGWKDSHSDTAWIDEAVIKRQARRIIISGGNFFVVSKNGKGSSALINRTTGASCASYESYVEVVPKCPFTAAGKRLSYTHDEDYSLYLEPNYPAMKPIDFLKGVLWAAGMFPYVSNGVVRFATYQQLIDNVAVAPDWSRFLVTDYEDASTIDFSLDDWAQTNWLMWKGDDQDNPKVSGSFTMDDEHLEEEKTVFTIPFKGCETGPNGLAMLDLWKSEKVVKRNRFVLIGLHYYLEEVDGFVLDDGDATIGVRHKQESGLDTLTFSELSFASDDGLLSSRYKLFAKMLQHPYVISCDMSLDEYTLAGLDMSVPVYLRQYSSYFALLSIRRKSDGWCTAKMMRIPNDLITEQE